MSQGSDPQSLSEEAKRLLHYLQLCCSMRGLARTDREIAMQTGLTQRDLVDLSDELISHGFIVVAEVKAPFGRWLCSSTGELDAARDYGNTLRSRAVAIFRRRRNLLRAIHRAESARLTETSGQRRLFT